MTSKFHSLLVISAALVLLCTVLAQAQDPAVVDPKCTGCNCVRIHSPVCGSDGVTYSNDCMLECAKKNCKADLTFTHCGNCGATPRDNCFGHENN